MQPANTPAQDLYDGLVKNKLIIPVGVPVAPSAGVPCSEDVLARFNDLITRLARNDGVK